MPAKTRLAELIAREEGFGKPGSIPTLRHNPGDLRHSPHSQHPGDPNAIGTVDSDVDGWNDLESQLEKYAARGMTLAQMTAIYAPPSENATTQYLGFLCDGLGCTPETKVSDVLTIPASANSDLGKISEKG